MTVSTTDRQLVDREFQPGELPVAESTPIVQAEQVGTRRRRATKPRRPGWRWARRPSSSC